MTPEEQDRLEQLTSRMRETQRESKAEITRVLDQHRQSIRDRREQRNRLVLLAVAITGFVIPMLASTTIGSAARWPLISSAVLLMVAIAVAVVFEVVGAKFDNGLESALAADGLATFNEQLARLVKRDSTDHLKSIEASDAATYGLKQAQAARNRFQRLKVLGFAITFLAGMGLLIVSLMKAAASH